MYDAFDKISDDEYLLKISQLPAPLKYAHLVYQTLLGLTKPEEVSIPMITDGTTVPVFRGNLTDVFKQAGASNAYYSEIRRTLIDSGSIHILERGTVHSPSVVVVTDKLPPITPVEVANVKSSHEVLTEGSESFILLSRRLQVLEERLGGKDSPINLMETLVKFERRLAKVEARDSRDSGSHESTEDGEESTTV